MPKTDEQLVLEYISGNQSALSQLIQKNLKAIYNFAYRIVGNAQDAEDVAQDTFIKAWKNIKQFKAEHNFKAWIFTIARNTAFDKLRKKKNFVFSDFENAEGENIFLDSLPDPEPPPDAIVEALEQTHSTAELLRRLPPLYREVLVLHYNENFTFKEIGEILNKSLNTVKSQHRRGLLLLRAQIDSHSQATLHQN